MIVKLESKNCVNGGWIADWLALDSQEHCQCIVECKVIVSVTREENEPEHNYIVNKEEYLKLIGAIPSEDIPMTREHYEKFKKCIEECKNIIKERPPSREASLALTKLDEAWMWFWQSNEDTQSAPRNNS